MVPAPRLAEFPVFDTADLDLASHKLGEFFGDLDLVPTEKGSRSSTLLNAVNVRSVTASCFRFSGGTRLSSGPTGFFAVQIPYYGRCRVSSAREDVLVDDTTAMIASPERPVVADLQPGCTPITLRIERDAVEQALSTSLGRQQLDRPLEFAERIDLNRGSMRTWSEVVDLMLADLERGGMITQHPLAGANMESLLINGLLQAQPHNYTSPLLTPARTIGAQAARRVRDFIEACPERPMTIQSLAREAGVSVRSLQESFRQEFRTSPIRHLREVRLDRVRDDLVAARDVPGERVTPVAARWGFTHMSRFAAAYRAKFGESPSATLRRPPRPLAG